MVFFSNAYGEADTIDNIGGVFCGPKFGTTYYSDNGLIPRAKGTDNGFVTVKAGEHVSYKYTGSNGSEYSDIEFQIHLRLTPEIQPCKSCQDVYTISILSVDTSAPTLPDGSQPRNVTYFERAITDEDVKEFRPKNLWSKNDWSLGLTTIQEVKEGDLYAPPKATLKKMISVLECDLISKGEDSFRGHLLTQKLKDRTNLGQSKYIPTK